MYCGFYLIHDTEQLVLCQFIVALVLYKCTFKCVSNVALCIMSIDESRPNGHQLHTVKGKIKFQTYQFDENVSNWGV